MKLQLLAWRVSITRFLQNLFLLTPPFKIYRERMKEKVGNLSKSGSYFILLPPKRSTDYVFRMKLKNKMD